MGKREEEAGRGCWGRRDQLGGLWVELRVGMVGGEEKEEGTSMGRMGKSWRDECWRGRGGDADDRQFLCVCFDDDDDNNDDEDEDLIKLFD